MQRFNWVERFDFISVLQLLAVSTNSVISVRIVLEFLRQEQSYTFQVGTLNIDLILWHTQSCVRHSIMLNHGLNPGLFFSLFKFFG